MKKNFLLRIDEEIFKISRFKSEKNMLRHVFYEFVKDIEVHDNSEILKEYIIILIWLNI